MDKYDKSSPVLYPLPDGRDIKEFNRYISERISKCMDVGRDYRTSVRTELGEEPTHSELWIQYSNFERDINREIPEEE